MQIVARNIDFDLLPFINVLGHAAADFLVGGAGHKIERAFKRQGPQQLAKAADRMLRPFFLHVAVPVGQFHEGHADAFAQAQDRFACRGVEAEPVEDVGGFQCGHGAAQGHEVEGAEVGRFLEIEQAVPVDDLAQGVEQLVLVGIQRQAGVNGAQHAKLIEAAQAGFGFVLAEDEIEFVQDARARQLFHQVQGKGVFDEFFPLHADVETVTLLEAHGPDDARGVFHEAQGMDDADGFTLDVALSAEEVHEAPELRLVESQGHGVDGEVAAEEVHLDG